MGPKNILWFLLTLVLSISFIQPSWSQPGRGPGPGPGSIPGVSDIDVAGLGSRAGRGPVTVLSNIDVRSGEEEIEIVIELNLPMRYNTHVLSEGGNELYIQLQPVAVGAGITTLPQIPETLRWKPTKTIPLKSVTFNASNPVTPNLEVRFLHPVSVKVRSGSDLRSIIITIPAVTEAKTEIPSPIAKKPARKVTSALLRTKNEDLGGRYVVNLEISQTEKDLTKVKIPSKLEKYVLYQVQILKQNKTWYRIRLGFFGSFSQAKKISNSLVKQYPDTWTTSVTPVEKTQALTLLGKKYVPKIAERKYKDRPVASDEKIEADFNEAKSSLVDKKYSHAIALFTKILRYSKNKYSQESLELLGVAREKNNQLAHARAEYEEYLRLYPGTADAERVNQRLSGILTAAARRPSDDGKKTTAARPASRKKWSTNTTLSQFFRHDTLQIEEEDSEATTTTLLTDINLNSRRRDEKANDRIQIAGSFEYDILNNGEKNVTRVREAYYDLNRRKSGISMRLGRQNQSTGGVLGRFDGIIAGYQITPIVKLNFVAGSPVLSTQDGLVETDRWFYGVNTDLGTFFNSVDLNLHYLSQTGDGLADRQSIGGELRYFDPMKSLFSLLDYDVLHDEVNVFLLSGNMRFKDDSSIYFNIDNRRSPLLATYNALQGQTVTKLDELLEFFNEDEIRQIARDRSLAVQTYSIGGTKVLSKKLQLTGDLTMSNQDSAPASAGIEAVESTGNEFFYTLQFIGTELFLKGAIDIIGLNYNDTATNERLAFNINSRYRLKHRWLLNPRLDVSKRKNKFDSGDEFKTTALFRVEKRFKRHISLEAEFGLEWISRNLADGFSDKSRGTFLYTGYRWDF
jgi:tetratricopeptide (TPR) repeat protein